MKLAVFSHKPCWRSAASPSGVATDGGFAFQMRALSQLFESTRVVVPCAEKGNPSGEIHLHGEQLSIAALTPSIGSGLKRKLTFPWWLLRNLPRLLAEVLKADAVHAPIPGDVGTVGMLMAFALRKPLFVRHCGNWFIQTTVAEKFWKWFMETCAGGRNVMLATGGAAEAPSRKTPRVRWIFSTSLTVEELKSTAVNRDYPTDGRLRLVIAARQEKAKGTGTVIESLPLLAGKFPRVTLDVLGDGAALGEFRQLTARLCVQDRVTFHGKVDHDTVLRCFQQADVFCFPTTSSEGFPKVVLEALACGLPVITTRVSVLPQLLASGAGVLLDEATPAALTEGVMRCVSSPEQYGTLSRQAAEVAQGYSLERWRDTIGQWCREAWGRPLNPALEAPRDKFAEIRKQCA